MLDRDIIQADGEVPSTSDITYFRPLNSKYKLPFKREFNESDEDDTRTTHSLNSSTSTRIFVNDTSDYSLMEGNISSPDDLLVLRLMTMMI